MSKIVKEFVGFIRILRLDKGLTYDQMADLAKVHRTAISKIENYERSPTLAMAEKLANALNIPLSTLIYNSEQKALGEKIDIIQKTTNI